MLRATVAPLGPTVSSRGVFDVTAYGADPTATQDSTDAIQSAVRAAMNSATHRTMGTVLFPSGSYSISRTINVTRSAAGDSSGVVLLGSGVAEITQQCFGCDVFFGAQLWRFTARQLWLRGGRHQLHVGNGNTNQGFFLIDDVQFENSSGSRSTSSKARRRPSSWCAIANSTDATRCSSTAATGAPWRRRGSRRVATREQRA